MNFIFTFFGIATILNGLGFIMNPLIALLCIFVLIFTQDKIPSRSWLFAWGTVNSISAYVIVFLKTAPLFVEIFVIIYCVVNAAFCVYGILNYDKYREVLYLMDKK